MFSRFLFPAVLSLLVSTLHASDISTSALKVCRRTCDELTTETNKMLHTEILDKGTAGALPICAELVEDLCRKYSLKEGVKVERITLLKLKEEKRSSTFEGKSLKSMVSSAKAGKDVKMEDFQWIESAKKGKKFVYLRAIRVQPMCLACHGPSIMVQPDVKKLMEEKYDALPSGNELGDIRGAFLVSLELPDAEALIREAESEAGEQEEPGEEKPLE